MTQDSTRLPDAQCARRTVLRTAAVAGGVYGGVGVASATTSRGSDAKGFPPDGITRYGESVDLGDGEVRLFTTETPSGKPRYHGVEFDRSALEGLPDSAALEGSGEERYTDKYGPDGEALEIHNKWSLEFFVSFPSAANTPFTFLGLNWNPEGHPGGGGAWSKPHFDIHFHMLDAGVVDEIEGPELPPYDEITGRDDGGVPTQIGSELEADQIPEGYVRSPPAEAEERYITDMGEHLAPADAPELPGAPEKFSNTLIQGFVGLDDNGADPNAGENPQLAFLEPMITREFLEGFSGTESYDISQPKAYPHDQRHPTTYSVRDVPAADAIVVVLQDFEET
ncbi:hypothetical protein U4E84_13925 [Halorubrum sp. AD140]|uniref:hypothetical protein n=1 Tax=Halorubrum sp. AD140 TaxID=3050073 RepID=UPI002ACCD741|nr:hypothetical protein [Halorubrum sp. AD140]MDZ5812444.1 hypothetical protein [Halorubrum sp. AD140]